MRPKNGHYAKLSGLIAIITWRFVNRGRACGDQKEFIKFFPPLPPIKCFHPINSLCSFLRSLFASLFLQNFSLLCILPVHKSFSQDHPFLEPIVSFSDPSSSFNFFLHFRVLEWDFLIFCPLGRLWLTLERFSTSRGIWMWHIAMRAILLSIDFLGPTLYFFL